ncbi:MAG: redoxin domain-containing protein [Chloroflexota bacterium]|nr:redoxin domain-containing protein [Chloroflexota bacterium]
MRIARIARLGAIVAIAALVVVLALAFRHDPQDIRSASVGKPAPALDLERLDGAGRFRLADHAGKVVVVNFFASWCVPCKQEYPALVRAWERYRTADVVIVGVLYQDSREAGLGFQQRMGGTWPTVADDDGRAALSFGTFGVPETFFVGPDGVVAGRHIGPIDEETLVAGIEAIRPLAGR